MRRYRLVGAILVGLAMPWSVLAWSGFTHQYISRHALLKMKASSPVARALNDRADLRVAFLGGTMAADAETGLDQVGPPSDLGKLYHSRAFANTLVDLSTDDPEALAFALGWLAHIVQDDYAHGESGYAETKRTFTGPAFEGNTLNHTLCEAMLDILVLTEDGTPHGPSLLIPERVAEAAHRHGHSVTVEEVKRSGKKFRWAYNRLEAAFLLVVRRQKTGILPSARQFYSDAWPGISGGKGIDSAIEATCRLLATDPRAVALVEGSGAKLHTGVAIANVLQGAESRLMGSIYGNEQRAEWILATLAKRGFLQRTPVIEFLVELINTEETDFEKLVRDFGKTCGDAPDANADADTLAAPPGDPPVHD